MLFVVSVFGVTLMYRFSAEQSFSYIQIAYDNISIERALQRIPTCTRDDRSHQRALLYMLRQWIRLAQKYHIQYWIAYQTLNAYLKHRALLPYQLHIDLTIMAQDTSQLLRLSQFNLSSIYKLKIHPQWFIVGHRKRSYFHSEGIDFLAPNARFINRNDHVYLNIWPVYDYDPTRTQLDKNSKGMLTQYDRNHKWKSSPKEWTFPLRECLFSGMKVWCPREAEKLLINIDGENSTTTASKQCINGSWITSNKEKSVIKNTTTKDESINSEQETEA